MKVPRLISAAALLVSISIWGQEVAETARQSIRVIESAGTVEFRRGASTGWLVATNGTVLGPGDHVRTRAISRAAVRFSDRSVMRLGENTVLEIQAPRHEEKRRFRLPTGMLFFFNREKPSDVEFETPVATGAIRGTEFVLESEEATGATRLALLDGLVEMTGSDVVVTASRGDQVLVERGLAPVKSPLIDLNRVVQWALYYPAVVDTDDLFSASADPGSLATAIEAYRSGDLSTAIETMSDVPPGDDDRELFRSALELTLGRVDLAESRISAVGDGTPAGRALREIIALVRCDDMPAASYSLPGTASEWLARSYTLQSEFLIADAREAAYEAVSLSPEFGFAWIRLAEMEMALDHVDAAEDAMDRASALSPRLAQVPVLRGFLLLERNSLSPALAEFDRAVSLDASMGNAWLGRGLAQLRLGRTEDALQSLEASAALEPRRAVARSYLGRGFSETGESSLAEKDFRLARELDPEDPTAWLYSALHEWRMNRPNLALDELERSVELNDNRRVYRSRLLLDRDRSVRSASLAAVYSDADQPEAGLLAAAQAVNDDYGNFAGHLFLSDSYRSLEDPNRFELRHETPRLSELLVANLLAPPGAGNLSQVLSQQERLRFFGERPFGASSFSQYRSTGDWEQLGSFFGSKAGLTYALDIAYVSQHGQEVNDWRERTDVSLQVKQRFGRRDDGYFQASFSDGDAGDVARHYDPETGIDGLVVHERQSPNLFGGWHHAWSPSSHTLLFAGRLTDSFEFTNPETSVLHLRTTGGDTEQVYRYEDNRSQISSDFTLYSGEVQQIWQGEHHTLIGGGRFQSGEVATDGILSKYFTGVLSQREVREPMRRVSGYLYDRWRPLDSLQLVSGIGYDRLMYPANSDLLPSTDGTRKRDLIAPKAGFLYTPWRGGGLRGAYGRSLGGVFFDNSVRIEPTQIAGFNQAFRSVAPESSVGLVPGSRFETVGLGFDQRLPNGLRLGIGYEWLQSDGDRIVGATESPFPAPLPGEETGVRQAVEFGERTLAIYAVQPLGDGLSAGLRYRLSDADLSTRLPGIPDVAVDLDNFEQDEHSRLHQLKLSLNYQHTGGFFCRWESAWYLQQNSGYMPTRPGTGFLQHDLSAGFRFPNRSAELRVGVLNLLDEDYRLSPLNTHELLPRRRMFVASLRLNY